MKKSKNTTNTVKTVKGYAIFNTEDEVYINQYYSECDENEIPHIYDDIEYVQEEIEDHNNPENYEIHKIKYGIQIEEIYERKVSYVLMEND